MESIVQAVKRPRRHLNWNSSLFFLAAGLFILPNIGLSATFNQSEFEKKFKISTPYEILQSMIKSKVTYNIGMTNTRLDFDIAGVPLREYSANPYLRRKVTDQGNVSVVVESPQGKIRDLFRQAADSWAAKDYRKALTFYQQSTEIDPGYFKAWCNLADTYFALGDYAKAIEFFRKALDLNPGGYQEHWFLADTYLEAGDKSSALREIQLAWLYNPHHEAMRKSLNTILDANGLRNADEGSRFPFNFTRSDALNCKIELDPADSSNSWMVLALDYAMWQMEPRLLTVDRQYREHNIINQLKYKEMLSAEYLGLKIALEKTNTISERQKRFIRMVEADRLNAFILWEIIEKQVPGVVLTFLPGQIEEIYDYIGRFVFIPK